MARQERYYARTADTRRVYPLTLMAGETLKLEIDWSQILGEKATSITNSCFETDSGTVGISDALAAGGVTSALAAGSSAGVGMVVNCVTLASGEILSRWWYIRVRDDPVVAPLSDYSA